MGNPYTGFARTSTSSNLKQSPDTPARVTDVPITSARRLRTLRGTLAELSTVDVEPDDLIKVVVTEPARAGLREEVRELLPGALEVHVERSEPATARTPERARTDRAPADLLHDYLAGRDVHDPRVESLFARLHDEVLAGE